MLKTRDVEILLAWDRIARHFRSVARHYRRSAGSFKDAAFRKVYGQIIKESIRSHLSQNLLVLKTDLWNEGIEVDRNMASFVSELVHNARVIGMDVSRAVCEFARDEGNCSIEIVRATLLASPFRQKFDFVIDISTVDHVPAHLRETWIAAESSLLRKGGTLLISFDSRHNLFVELYHMLFTRRFYPEWPLAPSAVRLQLRRHGFHVIREHAVFLAGLFLGTHRPWFPLARFLRREKVFAFLKRIELSNRSPLLSFLAPQYAMIAVKIDGRA